MWSGVRLVEALRLLATYDKSKFRVCDGFVVYAVAHTRGSKTVNNVYLPLCVYEKLERVTLSYAYARKRYRELGGKLSLKYLRKWNYNMLLYAGIPESVADFIQGRAGSSVSANHYLGKSQQAEFWYGKMVKDIRK
jgi:intergrase/recombinase